MTDPAVVSLKDRHRGMWALGDYPSIAQLVSGVGKEVVEAAEIGHGIDVLDVACGPGNAAIRAAQRGAAVTGVDLVPDFIEEAKRNAAEAGVEVDWMVGDAEELPCPDESFDRVLSAIGIQFAPRHEVVAGELCRVLRPGGLMVLGNWTREGIIGQLFKLIGEYAPPPPSFASPPPLWGDEAHVRGLFAPYGIELDFTEHQVVLAFDTVDEYVSVFEHRYGPTIALKSILEPDGRWQEFRARNVELGERFARTPGRGDIVQDYYVIRGRRRRDG
jgi:SAM-dependent methyltransferase